jgi:hypothetical protein
MAGPLTPGGANPAGYRPTKRSKCNWRPRVHSGANPKMQLVTLSGPLGIHHRQLVNPLSLSEMQLMYSEWSGETHEPNRIHHWHPGTTMDAGGHPLTLVGTVGGAWDSPWVPGGRIGWTVSGW